MVGGRLNRLMGFFPKLKMGFCDAGQMIKQKKLQVSCSNFFAFPTSHKCSDLAEVRKCIVT